MPKCPKCSKSFASERGLAIHASRCTHPKPATKTKRNWSQILVGTLAVLLLLNLVVMTIFTTTVGSKLTEAIELTKPQAVSLTLILPQACPACQSLEPLRTQIAQQNIKLTADETWYADTSEAQALISELAIQQLPALVLQSEKPLKRPLKEAIAAGSREISDSRLVWEQTAPPYLDLATGETTGLVTVTYLTDTSCTDCYDVIATQRPILTRFGVATIEEKIIDRKTAAGRELIEKYAITKVPTIILSAGTAAYDQLSTVWQQVGTVETDGSFVFRQLDLVLVTYRDLTTGQVVIPAPPPRQ